jgi:adenine phosphoribosyltransferase
VLATGGTAGAAARLVEGLGATVAGMGFIVELAFLGGRGKVPDYDTVSLISYE